MNNTLAEYKQLYERNEYFKRYVDRYCVQNRVSIEESLTHALVKEVGNMYRDQEKIKPTDISSETMIGINCS